MRYENTIRFTFLAAIAVSAMLALSACTRIEIQEVNVVTNATNCDVVRETEKQAAGAGDAGVDVVTRRGDVHAAAQMASAFNSSVYCKRDVIAADARISAEAAEDEVVE